MVARIRGRSGFCLCKTETSPHFSPPFVAKRLKGAVWLAFATEERAGIVDTMSSTPSGLVPSFSRHLSPGG
jgi:hypothetical protein